MVNGQPIAQQCPTELPLLGEGCPGVVLDLVYIGVHPPIAHMAVAPLGADDEVVDRRASGQPPGQELLSAAVRTSDVQIADPGVVGGVQKGPAPVPQSRHVPDLTQIPVPTGGDVRRPGDRGQPQTEARVTTRRRTHLLSS